MNVNNTCYASYASYAMAYDGGSEANAKEVVYAIRHTPIGGGVNFFGVSHTGEMHLERVQRQFIGVSGFSKTTKLKKDTPSRFGVNFYDSKLPSDTGKQSIEAFETGNVKIRGLNENE